MDESCEARLSSFWFEAPRQPPNPVVLPSEVVERQIILRLPLDVRLGVCTAVCRRWEEFAVSTISSIKLDSAASPAFHDSLLRWLAKHGRHVHDLDTQHGAGTTVAVKSIPSPQLQTLQLTYCSVELVAAAAQPHLPKPPNVLQACTGLQQLTLTHCKVLNPVLPHHQLPPLPQLQHLDLDLELTPGDGRDSSVTYFVLHALLHSLRQLTSLRVACSASQHEGVVFTSRHFNSMVNLQQVHLEEKAAQVLLPAIALSAAARHVSKLELRRPDFEVMDVHLLARLKGLKDYATWSPRFSTGEQIHNHCTSLSLLTSLSRLVFKLWGYLHDYSALRPISRLSALEILEFSGCFASPALWQFLFGEHQHIHATPPNMPHLHKLVLRRPCFQDEALQEHNALMTAEDVACLAHACPALEHLVADAPLPLAPHVSHLSTLKQLQHLSVSGVCGSEPQTRDPLDVNMHMRQLLRLTCLTCLHVTGPSNMVLIPDCQNLTALHNLQEFFLAGKMHLKQLREPARPGEPVLDLWQQLRQRLQEEKEELEARRQQHDSTTAIFGRFAKRPISA